MAASGSWRSVIVVVRASSRCWTMRCYSGLFQGIQFDVGQREGKVVGTVEAVTVSKDEAPEAQDATCKAQLHAGRSTVIARKQRKKKRPSCTDAKQQHASNQCSQTPRESGGKEEGEAASDSPGQMQNSRDEIETNERRKSKGTHKAVGEAREWGFWRPCLPVQRPELLVPGEVW